MAVREIIVKIIVDWEDYEDVCPELIAEDAIERLRYDARIKVLGENTEHGVIYEEGVKPLETASNK